MKRQERLPLNQLVNLAFAAAFIILVLVYVTCIILLEITASSLLGLSLLFIICILILGGAWSRSLRNMVTSFMGKVETLVDNATHGREPTYNYEETLLSSIEHKLMRYIEIARVNGQNLETEKNKIKELISDISHQTKTPLSNIMIYSQLLEESLVNDEHALQLTVQVKKQSEKLDWLIQSLIKLSRLETGMISLRLEPCPVIRAVSEAVSQILIQAENSRITISINCEPHITACYDPKWTTEVLFNLLENAVKYSEPGAVSISLRKQMRCLYAWISQIPAVESPRKSCPKSSRGSTGERMCAIQKVWELGYSWPGRSSPLKADI